MATSSERTPTAAFDYELPAELIAQSPAKIRDHCRLLVVHNENGLLEDRRFDDLGDYLRPGDVLIANETRVRAARLLGTKRTGGAAEVLLLRPLTNAADDEKSATAGAHPNTLWEALVKPGRRLKPGPDALVDFTDAAGAVRLTAHIADWAGDQGHARGMRVVKLATYDGEAIEAAIEAVGTLPLPPYIHDYAGDQELYQTVFSHDASSAAAPTAGLHFTEAMIDELRRRGIEWHTIDLEVGIDTFRTVDEKFAEDHQIHTERYSISPKTAAAVTAAKREGRRVIAVGTTSVRALESAWNRENFRLEPKMREQTSLFILPGYAFGIVDAMITNFHVPRSTLMMLVSAFAGRDLIRASYDHAIAKGYRMLSFGDAMFLIGASSAHERTRSVRDVFSDLPTRNT